MSADRPRSTGTESAGEADKPVAPAVDATQSAPVPQAEARSRAQHSRDIKATDPRDDSEPPVTATTAPPADSTRRHPALPGGQQADEGRDSTAASPRDMRGPAGLTTAGQQDGPAPRAPGTGTSIDRGNRPPAPDAPEPADRAGRIGAPPADGGASPKAETRSRAQFARDVKATDPRDDSEPPVTATTGQDRTRPAGTGPRASETEPAPAAQQRPARDTGQQDSAAAGERQDGKTGTDTGAGQQADSDLPTDARAPSPRPPADAALHAIAADRDAPHQADATAPPGSASSETGPPAGTETRQAAGQEQAPDAGDGAEAPVVESGTQARTETVDRSTNTAAERLEAPAYPVGTPDTNPVPLAPGTEASSAAETDEPPHLEGDEKEGSYRNLSWSTLPPEARTLGDLSPTGAERKPDGSELTEMESKKGRLQGLLRETVKEENLENLHDEVQEDAHNLQEILRPPEGHPVQAVADAPQATISPPAGMDAGGLAAAGLMTGIVVAETISKVHDILDHWKEHAMERR